MTTQAFAAIQRHTALALAEVKNRHCQPPEFKPPQPVASHIECPRCHGRLNFTVLASGITSGRCTSTGCVKWNMQ